MNINFELHTMNKQTISALIVIGVLIVICIIIGIITKKTDPKGKTPVILVPFIMLVQGINNMSKSTFGKRWKAYAPYLLTLALFLLLANISGIFGLETPTSYIVLDALLALSAFIVVELTGGISLGPGKFFLSYLNPLNIVSDITLPISLALRIMGNIMSGGVITSLIKGLVGINPAFFAVDAVVLPVMNLVFDVFSGLIQVLVFVLLTSIFAGMKVSEKDLLLEENRTLENKLVEEN